MPFIIKLVDFELVKNDFFLKTFYELNKYAAPEIWGRYYYTDIVNIWLLEVVILQYKYNLP